MSSLHFHKATPGLVPMIEDRLPGHDLEIHQSPEMPRIYLPGERVNLIVNKLSRGTSLSPEEQKALYQYGAKTAQKERNMLMPRPPISRNKKRNPLTEADNMPNRINRGQPRTQVVRPETQSRTAKIASKCELFMAEMEKQAGIRGRNRDIARAALWNDAGPVSPARVRAAVSGAENAIRNIPYVGRRLPEGAISRAAGDPRAPVKGAQLRKTAQICASLLLNKKSS